jgi:hypothetical protein
MKRINKKCEEAKKRLILIPHPKKKNKGEEPYLKTVTKSTGHGGVGY